MPSQEQLEKELAAKANELRQTTGCCQAARQKYWSELSIEEKIERAREQIKLAQRQYEDILDGLNSLARMRDELTSHRHNMPAGEVMLPAMICPQPPGYYRTRGEIANRCLPNDADPNQVYF